MDPLVGHALGPYELLARIGAGGMGTVYRAVHRRLRQQRAVKVLPHNLASDETFVQRFEREARLAAELRHPNIVVVHDVDDADGIYYIAMELLEGRSLRDLIREDSPVQIERALNLLDQLARALDFAHARSVVHRDIKPANVFVGAGDHVTLVDFGIARAADGTVLTGTGIMGTPEYMAPEMLRGETSGQTTDLYALGIVAFELLTSRLPFTGTNTPAIMYAQVHTPPPPLRTLKPELPEALEAVMARQLSKQSNERYSSAGAFVYALRAAAGRRQQADDDQDSQILDAVPELLATGDWQRALQELGRLADQQSARAIELRRRAELLRQPTELRPRPTGFTNLPTPARATPRPPGVTPQPVPQPPSGASWPPRAVTPQPVPIPGGYGSDPRLLRAAELRRRRHLLVGGGVAAVTLLVGGAGLGVLLRPSGDPGQGAATAKPQATATTISDPTRVVPTNTAVPNPPTSAPSSGTPPAATNPPAASATQTRIGYLVTLSQSEIQAQRGRAMLTLWEQSLTSQASKADPRAIVQFRGIPADDMGSPAGAVAAVNKLVNEDKVAIIVSLGSSATTMAAAPIAQQARIPFVSVFVESQELAAFGDFVFPGPRGAQTTSPPQLMPGIAERVFMAVKKAGEAGTDKMADPKAVRDALAALPYR